MTDDALTKPVTPEFHAVRGAAIQAYANLEQHMSMFFTHLAGTTLPIGALIFFKITDYRARDAIIERLFRMKFHKNYNVFRNSLIKELGALALERNAIVHWNIVQRHVVEEDGRIVSKSPALLPPNFYIENEDSAKGEQQINIFIARCGCVSAHISNFSRLYLGKIPPNGHQDDAWHGIFQKELTYPLPADHPLLQKTQKPDSPLQ